MFVTLLFFSYILWFLQPKETSLGLTAPFNYIYHVTGKKVLKASLPLKSNHNGYHKKGDNRNNSNLLD